MNQRKVISKLPNCHFNCRDRSRFLSNSRPKACHCFRRRCRQSVASHPFSFDRTRTCPSTSYPLNKSAAGYSWDLLLQRRNSRIIFPHQNQLAVSQCFPRSGSGNVQAPKTRHNRRINFSASCIILVLNWGKQDQKAIICLRKGPDATYPLWKFLICMINPA